MGSLTRSPTKIDISTSADAYGIPEFHEQCRRKVQVGTAPSGMVKRLRLRLRPMDDTQPTGTHEQGC